jgi:hypothetical protein
MRARLIDCAFALALMGGAGVLSLLFLATEAAVDADAGARTDPAKPIPPSDV